MDKHVGCHIVELVALEHVFHGYDGCPHETESQVGIKLDALIALGVEERNGAVDTADILGNGIEELDCFLTLHDCSPCHRWNCEA